jgi:hypothetical protein
VLDGALIAVSSFRFFLVRFFLPFAESFATSVLGSMPGGYKLLELVAIDSGLRDCEPASGCVGTDETCGVVGTEGGICGAEVEGGSVGD